MSNRVCPWWIGYLLTSPLRGWMQDPKEILKPYVREGMTVLEPGPGMGFFTIPLARLVGSSGHVVVDLRPEMIAGLKRRATKASVLDRIDAGVSPAESMMGVGDLTATVDFALGFAMVHEFPDAGKFFGEAAAVSKPGAPLLLAEPRGHVNDEQFAAELKSAAATGFEGISRPVIKPSHGALLMKR
ncbi:MAG TPA: methyltransferase domain-containing protein [Candidatus Sulfotelmatobacter sp.]